MSSEQNDRPGIARHILPTSGNLLGLCFTILSFIKVTHVAGDTFIDEILVVAIVLFLMSAVFSFSSIRSGGGSVKKSVNYEKIAEVIFISGLSLLAVSAIGVGLHLLH